MPAEKHAVMDSFPPLDDLLRRTAAEIRQCRAVVVQLEDAVHALIDSAGPRAPTGPLAENIAAAARRLNELREAWLNPPEWVDWVITPEEEKAGFPQRPVARPGHEADLKKRTLTNLYNARPAWLALAHKQIDAAVAAAYCWTDYTPEMPDDEILRRLLALNLERSKPV